MAKKKMTFEEKLEEAIVKDGLYKVPSNWIITKLCYLGKWGSGGTPSRKYPEYYNGEIPWIKTGELNNSYIYDAEEKITDEAINKSSAKIFPKGSVMLAMYGATIGKVGILNIDAASNQACAAIICDKKIINNKFMFYYLLSQRDKFIQLGKGGAQPNISQMIIKDYKCPLPPLQEQQRIVDRIESLFEKLDNAKELIEEARDDFEKRNTALLECAFNGELTKSFRNKNKLDSIQLHLEMVKNNRVEKYKNSIIQYKANGDKKPKKNFEFIIEKDEKLPQGWVKSKLDNLIYLAARIGWKGLKANEYTEKGPMFLSVYNLNYGDYVVFDKVYHISRERFDESPEIKVRLEDILLTKDGAGIGKLGFVNDLPSDATINSSLLLIRADEAVIPKYLFYFFKGPQLQRLVKERITGSAIPHLFQRDIKEFYLSIPPIEEQKEIVRILDSLLDEESKVEELTQLEDQIELIKKSILAKAFRGQLGTNDPEEESALELLKTILSK